MIAVFHFRQGTSKIQLNILTGILKIKSQVAVIQIWRLRMKTVSVFALMLFLPVLLAAQPGVPRNVEFTLERIEHALKAGSPASIEDLLPFDLTMRLEDSLYSGISRLKVMELLKKYFSDKDSVEFSRLERPGTGRLSYTSGGKRKEVYVDVWLSGSQGGILLYSLNISNYPYATMFMNIYPSHH